MLWNAFNGFGIIRKLGRTRISLTPRRAPGRSFEPSSHWKCESTKTGESVQKNLKNYCLQKSVRTIFQGSFFGSTHSWNRTFKCVLRSSNLLFYYIFAICLFSIVLRKCINLCIVLLDQLVLNSLSYWIWKYFRDLYYINVSHTSRILLQVTSLLRRMLPEVTPDTLARVMGVSSLPPKDFNVVLVNNKALGSSEFDIHR